MAEPVLDDLIALLPPLLRAMEALAFVGRHLDPGDVRPILGHVGAPDAALKAELPRLETWPEQFGAVRSALADSAGAVLAGFEALRDAAEQPGDMRSVYRALGRLPRAQEALYPLADVLPPVSRFFTDPPMRANDALAAMLARPERHEASGLIGGGGDLGARGAWSAYAPEYYTPDDAWPLVVALHGGAGNGRSYLWSWLRECRSYGALLIAPTAIGDTWALSGADPDTPNLLAILQIAGRRWNLDPERMLLTGMSDGGTFSYVSGLDPESPFTHLAPASAAFHPMLAQMADAERLRGLPIHIAHGALDWMFPVDMAREAQAALAAHGANVTYREIPDLGHTYPREINAGVLEWLMNTPPGFSSAR